VSNKEPGPGDEEPRSSFEAAANSASGGRQSRSGLELRVGRTANSAAPATPRTNAALLSTALRTPHVKNRKSRASFQKTAPVSGVRRGAETGGEGEAC